MHTRKSFPIWAVVLLVIAALATMGLVYGHWFDTLRVEGTVQTGTLDANFNYVFTDDDGANFPEHDLIDRDQGDDGNCAIGAGSCDPKVGGPNPERYTKAVGSCASGITDGKVWFTLSNVYPSYHCTVWVSVNNIGSIPWKFAGERYHYDEAALEVDWAPGSPTCGVQVDNGGGMAPLAGLTIHVKQEALQNATYTGWYEFDVVNWNEWDQDMCTSIAQ